MARFSFTLRLVLALALICITLFSTSPLSNSTSKAAALQTRGDEYVITYAADCVTPQTVFFLGDTVCAEAGLFPMELTARFRRFEWGAPDGFVARLATIKVDPQSDSFLIPTSGQFAQVGTWYLRTINQSGEGQAAARFIVRDPSLRIADLWISKGGPNIVLPGDQVQYSLSVGNPGPDFAEGVEFVTEVPSNMIFVALKQASGPFADCTTPDRGGIGRIICRVKGLGVDERADFDVYYQVNPDVADGTASTAFSSVSSFTDERNKDDNSWNLEVLITRDSTSTEGPVP